MADQFKARMEQGRIVQKKLASYGIFVPADFARQIKL